MLYILLRITCFELLFSNNFLLKPCTLIACAFCHGSPDQKHILQMKSFKILPCTTKHINDIISILYISSQATAVEPLPLANKGTILK
jgi:hypothetical protein